MTLLEDLLAYLVAEGLVRDPLVPGSEHPLWLEPEGGVPSPGEGETDTEKDDDLVLGAFLTTDIPAQRYEQDFRRNDSITIFFQARRAVLTHEFEPQIRAALADKRNWQMGSHMIIESLLYRGLSLLSSSETQGTVHTTEYLFERYTD